MINKCYGGFSLSVEALIAYLKRKDPNRKLYYYDLDIKNRCYKATDTLTHDIIILDKDMGNEFSILSSEVSSHILSQYGIKRDDPNLVAVVEEMGDKANGTHAKLCITEIDGQYRIVNYDGLEWIETPNSIKWES